MRVHSGRRATYLEVGARARLDVVRGEPLPHLNQSQAFLIVHVEHRLVDGGWEQTGGIGGGGGQRDSDWCLFLDSVVI